MKQRYEYKFVRLGEGYIGIKKEAFTYQDVIERHAEEGWRLVQVFIQDYGIHSKYYEVILEREAAN
jgi:uncharacterized protein DUF4177